MRKLAEVLKGSMDFFYSDTDDEIAQLLLRYGRASGGDNAMAVGRIGVLDCRY